MFNLTAKYQIHREQEQFMLLYNYNYGSNLDMLVRSLPDRNWSATNKCWYIPYNTEHIAILECKLNEIGIVEIKKQSDKETVYILKNRDTTKSAEKSEYMVNINNAVVLPAKDQVVPLNVKLPDLKKTAVITIDKEKKKIYLQHSYNNELFEVLYNDKNFYRNKSRKEWLLKGTNENYLFLIQLLKTYNFDYTLIYKEPEYLKETNPLIKQYVETLQMKNYSVNTIDAYYPHFKKFVTADHQKDINLLKYKEIYNYIENTIYSDNLQLTDKAHLINAIKFYYEKVEKWQKMVFYFKPKITINISQLHFAIDEIIPIIEKINKSGSKLLFTLHYCCDLKPEQIATLTLADTKQLLAQLTDISTRSSLKQLVTLYYTEHKPQIFLFEKQKQPYSTAEIEILISKIIQHFTIEEIYYKTFAEAFKQIDFEYTTQKNYRNSFLQFLRHFDFRSPATITYDEIRQFILYLNRKPDTAKNTIHGYINSIRFYYEEISHCKIPAKVLYRPKAEQKLPEILSLHEIKTIIDNIDNRKHRSMIALTYSGGLRRNELLNLKKHDIDYERNEIRIRCGKGKKDRITLLSIGLKVILDDYFEQYKPGEYAFEGATKEQYSATSFSVILKRAVAKSNIHKHVTIHTLRHSFATHLLENGTDLRYIQALLGHSDIKTTIRYTKVAHNKITKITSPFDMLSQQNDDNNKNNSPP